MIKTGLFFSSRKYKIMMIFIDFFFSGENSTCLFVQRFDSFLFQAIVNAMSSSIQPNDSCNQKKLKRCYHAFAINAMHQFQYHCLPNVSSFPAQIPFFGYFYLVVVVTFQASFVQLWFS